MCTLSIAKNLEKPKEFRCRNPWIYLFFPHIFTSIEWSVGWWFSSYQQHWYYGNLTSKIIGFFTKNFCKNLDIDKNWTPKQLQKLDGFLIVIPSSTEPRVNFIHSPQGRCLSFSENVVHVVHVVRIWELLTIFSEEKGCEKMLGTSSPFQIWSSPWIFEWWFFQVQYLGKWLYFLSVNEQFSAGSPYEKHP